MVDRIGVLRHAMTQVDDPDRAAREALARAQEAAAAAERARQQREQQSGGAR
ncbi:MULTISPECIES: hypothetical protein [Streptomyces]|uniref:hypothetical protein n=1 Tax=Streptomyces TaxID=1883 RepID=UPI0033CF7FF2